MVTSNFEIFSTKTKPKFDDSVYGKIRGSFFGPKLKIQTKGLINLDAD